MELPLKRIFAGLVTAFLLTAGLVVAAPQPATAACPYTNCIATELTSQGTRVPSPRTNVIYKVTVTSAGNSYPRGRVLMTVRQFGKAAIIYARTRRIAQASTNSSVIDQKTPNLRRGTYVVTFTYDPDAGTVFQPSAQKRKLIIR